MQRDDQRIVGYTDKGYAITADGKVQFGWKRRQPWRPTGWTPAELPPGPTYDEYTEAVELNKEFDLERMRARRRDQKYGPISLQREADRIARRIGGAMSAPRESRPDVRLMTADQLVALAAELLRAMQYDWRGHTARPEQLMPAKFKIWLLMAGRGFGKTRCAAEAVREVCAQPNRSAAVIAKDHRALRDVCFEGRSGLLSCFPPEEIKEYRKGLGDVSITLHNGSTIKGYTAGEPDAIRGQSFDIIWGDEFAAWPASRAWEMLVQARMCLRESKAGSIAILSTTPKRVKHVVDMVALAKDPEEEIVITGGSSRDNPVLSEEWHRQMERDYGGTRMGRQEINGELVMDNEHALWTGAMIEAARWDSDDEFPAMAGVITGVDPSGSKDGDATGISTVGWDSAGCVYVLENRTLNGTPDERYTEACRSAFRHGSTEFWYESAYGGDNCAFAIQQSWKNLIERGEIPAGTRCPAVKPSTLKGDKAARAAAVVLLYEQQLNKPDRRRIWHPAPTEFNKIAVLEDEMLTWETNAKKSPNAIDALVHAVRQILIKTGQEVSVSRPSQTRRMPGRPTVF